MKRKYKCFGCLHGHKIKSHQKPIACILGDSEVGESESNWVELKNNNKDETK